MPALTWETDAFVLYLGVTVLKATLVILGAGALAVLLRTGSAAVRHALWTGVLIVLVALPFLPLLPDRILSIPVPVLTSAASEQLVATAAPVMEPFAMEPVTTAAIGTSLTNHATARPPEGRRFLTLPGVLFAGWGTGALVLAFALAIGLRRSRRMIRDAAPLTGPGWADPLDRARMLAGFRSPVSLRLTPRARTPMAGGIRRPVVLVPPAAERWELDRRNCVLLHEVVHLRQRDPARQILGRVAVALYWFHPLVWWAVREAAIAREEACDERVIELGCRPSAYARHLIDLTPVEAPGVTGLAGFAGLTGFHHPNLEKRVMSILNSRPRSARRLGFITGTIAVLWATSIAALTPVNQASPEQRPISRIAADTLPPPAPVPPISSVPPIPEIPSVSPAPPMSSVPPIPRWIDPAPPPPTTELDPIRIPPLPPVAPIDACPGEGSLTLARHVSPGRTPGLPDDAHTVCIRIRGSVVWVDDMSAGFKSMAPGSTAELIAIGTRSTQRLEITPSAREGDFVHRWFVDDEERPVTNEVIEWRDALFGVAAATWHEIARLREHAEVARANAAELRGEHELLRAEAAEQRREHERLRAEAAVQRSENELLRAEAEVQRREHERLRAEAAEQRREHERLRAEAAVQRQSAEAAVDRLSSEIESFREQADLLEIQARMREVGQYRTEIERAAEHLRELIRHLERDR